MKIGLIVGAATLVGLCCGGALIAAAVGDDKKEPAAAVAPAITVPTVATTEAPRTASPSPTASPAVPVKMPELVGVNAAVADDQLKKLGFTNVQFGSADAGDSLVIMRSNWKVVEQSAAAGTTVQSDTLIVLTCTKKR